MYTENMKFYEQTIYTTATFQGARIVLNGRYENYEAARQGEAQGDCILSDGVFGHYCKASLVPYYEEDDAGAFPLGLALKGLFRWNYHESYHSYEDWDLVELKDFLQSGFARYGWGFVEATKDHDLFDEAFYKACLTYNNGKQFTAIPSAAVVFDVYRKICDRRGYKCQAQ